MSRSGLKSQTLGAHQTLDACLWTRTKRREEIRPLNANVCTGSSDPWRCD